MVIPAVIAAIILPLGMGFLGPREERLARETARMDSRQYASAFMGVKWVTWLFVVLVVAATFFMTAHVPA